MRTLLEVVNFDFLHSDAILPCWVFEFFASVLASRVNIHSADYWPLYVKLQFGHYLPQEFIPQFWVVMRDEGIEFNGEDGYALDFLEVDKVMVGYDSPVCERGGVVSLSPLWQFHDFPCILFNINIWHWFSPVQLNFTSSRRHIETLITCNCQSILWMLCYKLASTQTRYIYINSIQWETSMYLIK